jgi:predicted nucleotide-binding protein
MAYPRDGDPTAARPRARQNVILELGFFLGSIGIQNVFTLYRTAPNFEMPSDYTGVLYSPYDGAGGAWRYTLVQEMQAAGFNIDANRLTRR